MFLPKFSDKDVGDACCDPFHKYCALIDIFAFYCSEVVKENEMHASNLERKKQPHPIKSGNKYSRCHNHLTIHVPLERNP